MNETFDKDRLGEWSGTVKVLSLREQGKLKWVRFEGFETDIAFYPDAKFAEYMKEGDEKQVAIRVSESKTNAGQLFRQLISARKPGQGGGFGGGGRTFVPKSQEEIHAQPVATIIAEAIKCGSSVPESLLFVDRALDRYFHVMAGFNAANTKQIVEAAKEAVQTPVRLDTKPTNGDARAQETEFHRIVGALGLSAVELSKMVNACASKRLNLSVLLIEGWNKGFQTKDSFKKWLQEELAKEAVAA